MQLSVHRTVRGGNACSAGAIRLANIICFEFFGNINHTVPFGEHNTDGFLGLVGCFECQNHTLNAHIFFQIEHTGFIVVGISFKLGKQITEQFILY